MAASVGDVQAFYDTWYTPGNVVLAIAGDFDPQATRAWVTEVFGGLPARPIPERGPVAWPDKPARDYAELQDDVALPATLLLWHTPALYAPGDAELDVLAGILTGSDDGRLVKRLVYEDRSAQEVEAVQYSGRWGSVFLIQVFVSPDHSIEEVERAIDEELTALQGDRPPTLEEVERARNNAEIDKLYSAESIMGRAELLQSYWMHVGRFDWFAEDIGRYRATEPEGVLKEAQKLVPDRRARLHVVPKPEPAP
jgi:zinc protease